MASLRWPKVASNSARVRSRPSSAHRRRARRRSAARRSRPACRPCPTARHARRRPRRRVSSPGWLDPLVLFEPRVHHVEDGARVVEVGERVLGPVDQQRVVRRQRDAERLEGERRLERRQVLAAVAVHGDHAERVIGEQRVDLAAASPSRRLRRACRPARSLAFGMLSSANCSAVEPRSIARVTFGGRSPRACAGAPAVFDLVSIDMPETRYGPTKATCRLRSRRHGQAGDHHVDVAALQRRQQLGELDRHQRQLDAHRLGQRARRDRRRSR